MIASPVAFEMELPVGIEVPRGTDSAKAQDGLSAGERPASACAIHAVLDQVAARALDDAGGDWQPVAEGLLVAHQPRSRAVGEVAAGLLDRGKGGLIELLACGPPADGAGDVAAAAPGEKREEPIADPAFAL